MKKQPDIFFDISEELAAIATMDFPIGEPLPDFDPEEELQVLEKLSSIQVIEQGIDESLEDIDFDVNPDQIVALTDLEELEGQAPSKIHKVSSMGRNSLAVDLKDGRTFRVFMENIPQPFPRFELEHGLVAYLL